MSIAPRKKMLKALPKANCKVSEKTCQELGVSTPSLCTTQNPLQLGDQEGSATGFTRRFKS